MKINVLELHNHVSHPDTRVEFNGTHLAAFTGENGAGKSSLLEAIKYILYDAARLKTDGLVRIGQTDMSASVEFEFAGATYRAVRGRTSKGAGKSYLELAVQAPDSSWTSLTGDDIRSTQARIVELLGLDADAFATAVFIGQGDVKRFVEATAGERKRILSTVLGLDVYARAETRAREEARDLEATTGADRSHCERTSDAIAELEPCRDVAVRRAAEIHELAGAQTTAAAERDRNQARLTELAGEIAKGDAAAAEVTRLEAERTALAERYRRERTIVADADAAIAGARVTLASVEVVTAAIADLPAARAEVETLAAAEAEDRRLADEIEPKRRALDHLIREQATNQARWESSLGAERSHEAALVAQGKSLKPVICEKCQHPNIVDQADIRGQLVTTRERIRMLEGEEPTEPLMLAFDRAAMERLESRRRELAWDPAPLRDARARLADVERLAGRQEAMDAAAHRHGAAVDAKADAEAELVKIEAVGQELASRIAAAKATTEGAVELLERQADAKWQASDLSERIRILETQRREAERGLATAEASVDRLDQLTTERDAVTAKLVVADVDLARLRRLVAAFGVTGIPARIIEGVLPELAAYANELLGELRPGMVIELQAQRAKRDGKGIVEALDVVVRDEVGERPIEAYSGGETTSICLALAVGLSRLAARRSGARIESLLVDEPDGLDDKSRRAFGQALRALAHRGELARVIWISHHPDLTDYADQVWQVTKDGSGSKVDLVA